MKEIAKMFVALEEENCYLFWIGSRGREWWAPFWSWRPQSYNHKKMNTTTNQCLWKSSRLRWYYSLTLCLDCSLVRTWKWPKSCAKRYNPKKMYIVLISYVCDWWSAIENKCIYILSNVSWDRTASNIELWNMSF